MATKLRWEFPQTIFTTTVLPSEFKRTHQEIKTPIVLHNCLNGYDEQGALIKTLYCTRSGRFFVRKKDGWSEQQPCDNHLRRKRAGRQLAPKGGGGADCPFMANYGQINCHRLVAYAWCEHPRAAKADPEWYKRGHGYEVDHKNCDHGNWCADNLEWVTTKENIRRRNAVLEPLRKLGINPKFVNIPHLKALYAFEECQLEYFFEELPKAIQKDERALELENINDVIHNTILGTLNVTIRCDRCGCKMIEDTDEHDTRYGTLCDCCYGEMYD